MEIKQIIKKALCFFVSAIMLTASLPTGLLAQFGGDITEQLVRDKVQDYVIVQGKYVNGVEEIANVYVDQKALVRILQGKDAQYKAEDFFDPEELFAPADRVQIRKAIPGEDVTWVSKPYVSFTYEAKPGQYIVTVPKNGKPGVFAHGSYLISEADFKNDFEPVKELGDDIFMPKWRIKKFRKVKVGHITVQVGSEAWHGMFEGNYIDVTDPLNPRANCEYKVTYKPVSELFAESRARLVAYLESVGKKLNKTEKELFDEFLQKGSVFTKTQARAAGKIVNAAKEAGEEGATKVVKNAGKSSAKSAPKAAAGKTAKTGKKLTGELGEEIIEKGGKEALKVVVGAGISIGLYITLSTLGADKAQAQVIMASKTRNEIINESETEIPETEDPETNLLYKAAAYATPGFEEEVSDDAWLNNGALLKDMIETSYAVESVSEDRAAEILTDMFAGKPSVTESVTQQVDKALDNQFQGNGPQHKPYKQTIPLPDDLP